MIRRLRWRLARVFWSLAAWSENMARAIEPEFHVDAIRLTRIGNQLRAEILKARTAAESDRP